MSEPYECQCLMTASVESLEDGRVSRLDRLACSGCKKDTSDATGVGETWRKGL
jgi:hypothetical protein